MLGERRIHERSRPLGVVHAGDGFHVRVIKPTARTRGRCSQEGAQVHKRAGDLACSGRASVPAARGRGAGDAQAGRGGTPGTGIQRPRRAGLQKEGEQSRVRPGVAPGSPPASETRL